MAPRPAINDLLVLTLLVGSTFGFWVFQSAFVIVPLWRTGEGLPVYFDVATIADLVQVALASLWAFVAICFGRRLVTRPATTWVYIVVFGELVYLFIQEHGAFIPRNYRPDYFERLFALTALLVTSLSLVGFGSRSYYRKMNPRASAQDERS